MDRQLLVAADFRALVKSNHNVYPVYLQAQFGFLQRSVSVDHEL